MQVVFKMYLVDNYIWLALVEMSVILQQKKIRRMTKPLSITNKFSCERSTAVIETVSSTTCGKQYDPENDDSRGRFSFSRVWFARKK